MASNLQAHRILDAAANRAAEGLRVVEDYARFVLDDAHLTRLVKSLRHDLAECLAALPRPERLASRETQADVGAEITTPAETNRTDAWQVCVASSERVKQSLRSLEEFGKIEDPDFAAGIERLRYRHYTLERALGVTTTAVDRLEFCTLCVLVDGGDTPEAFTALVQELVAAETPMIQLRDKRLDDRELLDRARTLVELTRSPSSIGGLSEADDALISRAESGSESPPTGPSANRNRTLAIINDRADIAAASGADGVHLGQEDLPVKAARGIVGPRALVGVSTHAIEQARAAVLDGADYLGAGPTFPSQTKSFDAFPGPAYLAELAAEIRLPTFAIGGIHAENLPEVLAAGVGGVAVSSAVTSAAEPGAAVRTLLRSLSRSR
ncbi:MAG: thiamine phosphate synthase [Planctomycetota bacterium]